MLEEILTKEQCKDCKGCCIFDDDDRWEAPFPLLSPSKTFDGAMPCIHLMDNGCNLGKDKPLECSIYPFRLMHFGDKTVISLCRYCKAVINLSLKRIIEFTDKNEKTFIKLLNTHPEIVKNYDDEYVILKVL